MITIKDFKYLYDSVEGEPEFEIYFKDIDPSYMIIKYDDGPTFQRCGYEDGSDEYKFKTLDELINTNQIDGINLKRDWSTIEHINANNMSLFDYCWAYNLAYKEEYDE